MSTAEWQRMMVKTSGSEDQPQTEIRAPARTAEVSSVPRWSSAPLAAGKVVWNTGDEAAEGHLVYAFFCMNTRFTPQTL